MENKMNFIKPEDTVFAISHGGLLELCFRGEKIGRVSVLRMFPFQYEEEYLCVRCENYSREDKEKEIGIIRSLSDFPNEQIQIVRKELERRYFVPEIITVYEVKEEYGNTMWRVLTNAGERKFTVTDMSNNVRNLGNNKIMLTDVYANRYYIPDITKSDDKTVKVIEIWV